MKNAVLTLSPFVLTFMFSCCKCHCEDSPVTATQFKNIVDTSATYVTVGVYTKGSNFSKAIRNDSSINMKKGLLLYIYNFNYDYLLTVYPAGNSYKLTGLSYGNATESSDITGGCGDPCYNGISYSVNDSTYNLDFGQRLDYGGPGIVIN